MSHVIVCGLGQVGFRCALLLHRLGEEVVVVTSEDRRGFAKTIGKKGIRILYGDATDIDVLREAGLETAKALLAVTSSDMANLEIGMDALEAGVTGRIVLRLFDQTLTSYLQRESGIHRSLAMSNVAAPFFATAALDPSVLGAFEWRGEKFSLVTTKEVMDTDLALTEKLVARPRPRVERSLPKLELPNFALGPFLTSIPVAFKVALLLICALATLSTTLFCWAMKLPLIDSFYFVVTTLTTTGYGDISPKDAEWWVKLYTCALMILGSASVAVVYSIITDYVVSTRFDELAGKQKVGFFGHVIVVGMGNVGSRVVAYLDALGVQVVAVDSDSLTGARNSLPDGVPLLVGDGRELETLERAGAPRATAVIVATDNDATNLSIGLCAKKMNSGLRTVVRLFDASFARKVEGGLNIDVALSASKISAPSFVGAALGEGMIYSFTTETEFNVIRDVDGKLSFSSQPLTDF